MLFSYILRLIKATTQSTGKYNHTPTALSYRTLTTKDLQNVYVQMLVYLCMKL